MDTKQLSENIELLKNQIVRKIEILRVLKESPLNLERTKSRNSLAEELTQRTSNVARRVNNCGVEQDMFDEKCRQWRRKRHVMDNIYVNLMVKNVLYAFWFGKNESKNVLDSYGQIGERYDILAPQLVPVYSLAVQKLCEGVESEFWVEVLNILISITKRLREKEDFMIIASMTTF